MGKKDKYMGGAAVLALSNVVCRILGFLFKVPLSNLIGSEGMGYFSLATQVFGVAAVATGSGMPVVLTRMTAEKKASGGDTGAVLKSASHLFLIIGAASAVLMGISAPLVCRLAGTEPAAPAVTALAPAAFFVSAETAYRAYFQGRKELGAGAAAQLAEAVFKLAVGTGAAWILHKNGFGASVVAAGAAFGVTAGTCAAAGALRIRIARSGGVRTAEKIRGKGAELLKQSLPITAGAVASGILSALDAVVILKRLAAVGYDSLSAASVYGIYTGYAVTVYALPFALTGAVNAWVAPTVAAAYSSGNGERLFDGLNTAVKAVCAVAFPAAFCFLLMPKELTSLFFSRSEAALAAPLLAVLSVSAVVCPLSGTASCALQAMGKPRVPVAAGIVSGIVKLAANWILIGRPGIGICGAPVSAGLSMLVSLGMCGAACRKELRRFGKKRAFAGECVLLPAACGLLGAFCASNLAGVLAEAAGGRLSTLCGIFAGGAVYAGLLWLTGVVTGRELSLFQIGKRNEE